MNIPLTSNGGTRRRSLWKGPALITALVLMVPLVRNLAVYGWDWDLRGFLVVSSVGTLLFSMGLTYQLVTRKLATPTYRAAAGVALVAALLLVWGNFVQAADDVNPNSDALMYLAVPLVGIIGAALARFESKGMARALFAAALAQALVLAMVLVRNPPVASGAAAAWRGLGGNVFCLGLFIGSALLFRKAARGASAPG